MPQKGRKREDNRGLGLSPEKKEWYGREENRGLRLGSVPEEQMRGGEQRQRLKSQTECTWGQQGRKE
jgi:hypothetical protein